MYLAQIENGICVSIYTSDSIKDNTVEIESLNSDYLFRRYENDMWGDRIEVTIKEENGLTEEQEQTVLTALSDTLALLTETKARLDALEQSELDRDELLLNIVLQNEEIKLNQQLGSVQV